MSSAPIGGPESPILCLGQRVRSDGLEQVPVVERQFLRTRPQDLKLRFVIAVISNHQVAAADESVIREAA